MGHKAHSLENFPYFSSASQKIVHYTCNAPPMEILNKHKIKCSGRDFGCQDEREILLIPTSIYLKFGFRKLTDRRILQLNLENLMKKLK